MAKMNWTGSAWLRPGLGVFRGNAGDNALHAHYAHQVAIALEGEVEVTLAASRLRGAGIVIPANIRHQLAPQKVLLIYLDPTSASGRALFAEAGPLPKALPAPYCKKLLTAAQSQAFLQQALTGSFSTTAPSTVDERLVAIVAKLEASLGSGIDVNRDALAAMVNLSPSRFSHWFVAQAGMPLRGYRKWLRLLLALNNVAHTGHLTEAAHAAGFADSAHFSRTFRQMFGISPMAALQQVSLHAEVSSGVVS
jgi:AraC-like DNA-binding protein